MFDKLEDLVARLDELQNELSDPNVASNAERFRNLMKEQANLAPIVEKYQEYKEAKQGRAFFSEAAGGKVRERT